MGNKDTRQKKSIITKITWVYTDKTISIDYYNAKQSVKIFSLKCITQDYIEGERNTIICLLYII